ncbi:MAG: hypothetical protein LAT78_00505 [Roseinatronobacter sp.]|jgi:hypothetical protein|nr:hypothetical protein [Roseinatronobacter sp.]
MALSHTKPAQSKPNDWRREDEPWPIWAALMVFLNALVIAVMVWGLPGLVTVMVGAAFFMVVMLILIVSG